MITGRYLDFLIKTGFNFKKYINKTYNMNEINKLIKDYKNGKIIWKELIKIA